MKEHVKEKKEGAIVVDLKSIDELYTIKDIIKNILNVESEIAMFEIDKKSVKDMKGYGYEFVMYVGEFGIVTKVWKDNKKQNWRLELPKQQFEVDGEKRSKSLVFLQNGNADLYEQLTIAIVKKLSDLGLDTKIA